MLKVKWLLTVVMVMLMSVGGGANAQASFTKDEYYLGRGGTPPTLSELAETPETYFRSPATAAALAAHLGVSLDELGNAFMNLREEPCAGRRIRTAGLAPSGAIVRFERACYEGEVLLMRGSAPVASTGCLNPVYGIIVTSRTPTRMAETPQCRMVPIAREQLPGAITGLSGVNVCNCFSAPGFVAQIPGGMQQRSRMVCE